LQAKLSSFRSKRSDVYLASIGFILQNRVSENTLGLAIQNWIASKQEEMQMGDVFDLRKEEYLSLRKEIESCLTELSNLERNCVIGSATAYAWVATNATLGTPLVASAWLIPAILPVYGAARSRTIGEQLGAIGCVHQADRNQALAEATYLTRNKTGGNTSLRSMEDNGHKDAKAILVSLWILSVVCSLLGYGLTLARPNASTSVAAPASAPSSPATAIKAP